MNKIKNVLKIIVLFSIIMFANIQIISADSLFSASVNYGVGTWPYSVTSADFDGDNNLDLAVANWSNHNVSILLGNGDGTFDTAVNYGAGTTPSSVTSADFDGDNNLDLAVANYASNDVSILLGNGDGTFDTAVNYGAGTTPSSVTSADFDGDNNLDLAVANRSSNDVSILLGNGDGTFDTAVNYGVGTWPYSVTSADFDGDNNLDLAVANWSSNDVSILLGNGDGTFDTAVNYGAGTTPSSVTSADFDGDNNLDLAVANKSSNDVSILINARVAEEPESPFAGGTGTEGDPFQIETCEQLQDMNYYDGETYPYLTGNYYFILNNDINCSDTVNWNDEAGFMPIGLTYDGGQEYGTSFIGIFDGNNKTISNLYINRPTYRSVGLFGTIGSGEEPSNIKNVNLTHVNIVSAYDSVGALAGNSNAESTIINISISGEISGNENGGCSVGGLVGDNHGYIEKSYTSGNVSGYCGVGGLAGASYSSETATIINSYSTSDVFGIIYVGGLVGFNECNVTNSYATGSVTGTTSESEESMYGSGGLVGVSDGGYIKNSYATGNVIAFTAGGLVGTLFHNEGDPIDTNISNSGWYKSRDNNNLHGIGLVMYEEKNPVSEGSAEVTYTETDNEVFYSSDHGVYDQGGEDEWGFNGNPWYEYDDNYPQFVEPEEEEHHSGVSSGTGTSIAVLAQFQAEQQARALAAGIVMSTSTPTSPETTQNTPTFTRILKLGMTGQDVRQLQIYLNTHGYVINTEGGGSPGNETNYFGLKTETAVKAFQTANGLTADGIVGIKTRALLK